MEDGLDELRDLFGLGVNIGGALEGGLGDGEGAGEVLFGLCLAVSLVSMPSVSHMYLLDLAILLDQLLEQVFDRPHKILS